MFDIRTFREVNSIRQKDLADFLGVSVTFISNMENGLSKIPGEKLGKILDNDKGWDTTCLIPKGQNTTHSDYQNQGGIHVTNGKLLGPVHMGGKSDEEISNIIKAAVAEYEAENRSLHAIIQAQASELGFLRSLVKRAFPNEGYVNESPAPIEGYTIEK